MVFNQGFTLSWNAFHANLMQRVAEDRILRAVFTSPFSMFAQSLEMGNYEQETYINPAKIMLHDTVTNSDMLSTHTDTIMTAIHNVNVDLNIPSTYREYLVRTSFNFWDNVNTLVTSLVANLRVTVEIARHDIIKQMLYNAYSYGMIDAVEVDPPTDKETSDRYVIAVNSLLDDFVTEVNTRNMIYNNQIGVTELARGIATEVPYVIIFNEFLRTAEQLSALELRFGQFDTGNSNQDYARRLIRLQHRDFPDAVPPTPRPDVTGQNVVYDPTVVNFFPMPQDSAGEDLFAGEPIAGDTPIAFVIDPNAFRIRTQLDLQTNFMNPATAEVTNRIIMRALVSLSGFEKIACVATTAPVGGFITER